MKGADQVLAGVGVDAGLAADRRVDHRQQRGRHVHDRHAAQPGRRGEAGDIGRGAAAQADQRILAANADAAQHFPDVTDDRQVLARFGVRDFDLVCVNALVGQVVSNGFGGLRQHRLMQDGDAVPAGEQVAEFAEQAAADDDRVGRVDVHVHGDRFARLRHFPASALPCLRAAASAAGVAGVGGGPVRGSGTLSVSGADGRRHGGRRRLFEVLPSFGSFRRHTMWRTTAPGLRRLVFTRIVATFR